MLFSKKGYRVQLTPYVGDWGADLIVSKGGVRTAVQAKRYGKKVGVRAVQEAVAAKGKYQCAEAMVVTNSFYTDEARDLARANRVALWDRNELVSAPMSIRNQVPRGGAQPAPVSAAVAASAAPAPVAAVYPLELVFGR